jgi:hypothetical protein
MEAIAELIGALIVALAALFVAVIQKANQPHPRSFMNVSNRNETPAPPKPIGMPAGTPRVKPTIRPPEPNCYERQSF